MKCIKCGSDGVTPVDKFVHECVVCHYSFIVPQVVEIKPQNEPIEPTVIKCGVRHSYQDEVNQHWDIECRFSDGQKFAAIQVDIEFEQLAHKICNFLNGESDDS